MCLNFRLRPERGYKVVEKSEGLCLGQLALSALFLRAYFSHVLCLQFIIIFNFLSQRRHVLVVRRVFVVNDYYCLYSATITAVYAGCRLLEARHPHHCSLSPSSGERA